MVRDVHDDGLDKDPSSSVYWPILAAHFTGTEEFHLCQADFMR